MRKKILLFIVAFILGVSNISAYTTTGDKCLNDRSCIVACNYTNKSKRNDGSTGGSYITIYYNFKSNNFSVGLWKGLAGDGNRPYLKGPDYFDKIFSTQGTNIFVQPALNLNENTFKCPAHGYFDLDDWVGGNEACFDSDGNWCATAKKNAGTRFGTAASKFISETRDMTFEDEIKQYFKNWSIGDIDIEDIKSGKYKTAEDVMEKIFLKDFRKNYLNENKIPQFIKNSEAYQSGVALAEKQFEALKKSWLAELEEEKNAGTLSEEEFNEIAKNLDAIDENFEEVGKDYANRIDVIDVRPGSLDVTPVNICKKGTTSLKVFQVIGYILMLIKIIVPLILIILGSIDFGKASMSGDDKAVKDAAVQFAKRVLIGLIVFFVPTVLDFFLSLVNGVSDTAAKFSECTNCIFSPTNESRCDPGNLNE